MIYKTISISAGENTSVELFLYIIDNSVELKPDRQRPIIIICPGGGYCMTSDREAEPVALQYLAMGYHTAILRYSVKPAKYPAALLELGTAVKYLKEHAREYHIDPRNIFLQGFSAGGHLAGCLGVLWNTPWLGLSLANSETSDPSGNFIETECQSWLKLADNWIKLFLQEAYLC